MQYTFANVIQKLEILLAQCRILVLILRCFEFLLSPLQMRLRLSLVSLNLLLQHSGPILETCHTDLP